MAATRVDFTVANKAAIETGSKWEVIIPFKRASDGLPFSFQGYTGRCQIRKTAKLSDTTVLAEPLVSFVGDNYEKIKLSLTAAETDAIITNGANFLEPAKYVYDVEATPPNETDPIRALEGFVYVKPGVTRNG